MISGIDRPRNAILPLRNPVPWQTPAFDGPRRLRNEVKSASKMELARGLEFGDDRKNMQSKDRTWIENLVHARVKSEIDGASYSVLKRVHGILVHHEISRLEQILKNAPVERLAVQVLLGFLASTLKAKTELEERDTFYAKVEARLERDEPLRAASLLRGLR